MSSSRIALLLNYLTKEELQDLFLWLYKKVEGIVTEEQVMYKIREVLARAVRNY